jgi:anthranilate synthase component 1
MNILPTIEKIKQIVRETQGNVIPVYQDLSADLLTPIAAYLRVSKDKPYSFLFESVLGGEKIGRYSFIGTGIQLYVWFVLMKLKSC